MPSGLKCTEFTQQSARAGGIRSPPPSASSQDQQPAKPTIPSQKHVTQQLTTHWPPFKALRQTFANTRFAQQLQLHLPQKVKATDQDSAPRVEMSALEDQAANGKRPTARLASSTVRSGVV